MATQTLVPVTMRALVQRVNRRLAPEHTILKKARGAQAIKEVGVYYTLNCCTNHLVAWHVDPVALAKELGVLAAWETVVEEEG